MTPTQLLQHFDRLSEAPDAIPRLRRFILELAVRGKLVEQDLNDEPAVELLKRIQKEKTGTVKRPARKQGEALPDIDLMQAPFILPLGWSWARFPELGIFARGKSKHRPRNDSALFQDGTHLLIQTGDVARSQGLIQTYTSKYNEVGLAQSMKWPAGTLCITIAANIADSGILSFDACFPDSVVGFVPASMFQNARYFEYFMRTAKANLLEFAPATAQKNINLEILNSVMIPLPPLAEQHRIVSKVDELMALCDQLEAAKAEREQSRDRLLAANLHHLNQPADDEKVFREHVRFTFNHLPRITTRPAHIKQLRQTILNLAVRGKLVEQDPNDEPIKSILFGLDAAEENIFNVPHTWGWRRISDLSVLVTDGEHATPTRISEQQVPLVTAKNVRDGEMDYITTDWVSFDTAEKAWRRCRPMVGDILLVCVGATTGRLCILREPKDMVLVRSVALIRPSNIVDVDYLALAIRAPHGQSQIWSSVKTSAQPCLYINRIISLLFPLPPIAEQHRIVAKVNELMTLCDQLETQLNTTESDSRRLLEAVLHEALMPLLDTAA